MDSSTVGTSVSEVLREVLGDTTGEAFMTGFREDATENLLEVVAELPDPPVVRIFAEKSVLRWVRDDFLLASTATDLQADEVLSWRVTDEPVKNTLVVTEESVVSIVSAGEHVAGLLTDNTEFVESVREKWTDEWDEAEEFNLRAPPRSQIYETLAEQVGSEIRTDFQTMLNALGTARGDDLNEVCVILLAAAKHGIQLYEISHWGEDVGFASKATFSRTKNRLEDQGLIETEKVPLDVGRPRLRLMLGDQRLRDADAEDLLSVAQELLSGTPV